ncbi:MAG: hypothetical protein J7K75_02955 [Desulfuromonas sp.]|nr:hypothetical protein [Desulfuromonas sp.]
MVYVKRDDAGNIVAAGVEPGGDWTDEVASDSAELQQFTEKLSGQKDALTDSDLPMVRVLDDLIDVLVERGVLRFTDFPEDAQRKLFGRRSLREQRNSLKLFVDESEELF